MIDEKKLIEWAELVRDDYKNCFGDYDSADVVQYIIDGIIEQPKVGEWIPCSERLPEYGQTVLIQYVDRHDDKEITMAVGWMNVVLYSWDDRITGNPDAVAWMPLPEPYKEEGAGHEE